MQLIITSNGVGVHRFESYHERKRVISDIICYLPLASGYENKEKVTVSVTGINTAS